MKLPHRRQFVQLATGAAALPAVSHFAWAQAYPSRPVRIIVGFPPGATADTLARLMGQWLSEHLAQPVIVENRPGAGTNLAAEVVVRAPADGHTLLLTTSVNTTNTTLYEKLSFDFIRDIAPVAGISREPLVMAVTPALPSKAVPEFIAYAKANPGKLNMASAGNGTGPHVAGELFKMMASVDMVHVPYRGSAPALTDLLGGQVQVMFAPMTASIGYIRAGTLRALAVASATRSDALPGIPTLGDFLPGYEASVWTGLGAPRGTPIEIVDKLNAEINSGLADPTIKARLTDLGGTVLAGSPADFGRLIADDTEKWAKVVKFAGIKPE
jgi:tripartite-type tricarboxylate transporter receptor subunit TctC